MRTLCWWCKAENKTSETKCNNCGAPLNQNLQSSSAPGLFSKWATLIIEAVVLFVCITLVFSWLEEVERSEASKTQHNPVTVIGTPSPSPPTPKPRSANRRRTIKKKDEFPVLPTERAPSPDIPMEDNSSTPNQNGQRFN
jgi:hypothetical protein